MTSSPDDPPVAQSSLADSVQCASGPDDSAARLEGSAANGVKDDSDAGSTEPLKPPATVHQFEKALRALGFGSRQAKAIARSGFRPAMAEPDDADDLERLAAALRLRGAAMKGTP